MAMAGASGGPDLGPGSRDAWEGRNKRGLWTSHLQGGEPCGRELGWPRRMGKDEAGYSDRGGNVGGLSVRC